MRKSSSVMCMLATVSACSGDAPAVMLTGETQRYDVSIPAEVYSAAFDSVEQSTPGSGSAGLWILDPSFVTSVVCEGTSCMAAESGYARLPVAAKRDLKERWAFMDLRKPGAFCKGALHIEVVSANRLPTGRYVIEMNVLDLVSPQWTLREGDVVVVECFRGECRAVGRVSGEALDVELESHFC
jgi:hypothetical protein